MMIPPVARVWSLNAHKKDPHPKPQQKPKKPCLGWSLWRQDDNGNEFEMERGLPHEEAERLQQMYTKRGHKQSYHIARTVKRRDPSFRV